MDAVEFLKAADRMHNFDDQDCVECEIYKHSGGNPSCVNWVLSHPDEAVKVVEQWAKEHPRKTRRSEFLNLFPNARIGVDGCIGGICPSDLDTEFVCPMQKRGSDYACCPECRRVYWHAEVKDNAD